ncbi:hypothetical protein K7X08_026521 [Anisodus acutangulus]|uniref:GH10 domain-containing protein n=1 Tax=Anisodus acutangulus TaxID=402998 RepID=A0A9Q1LQZ1_9SOLA|nr:hypothetical protein K7X08_026521 [Anisodus acutangulus]
MQTRKSKVKFQDVDHQGQPLANAKILIKQTNTAFAISNAISSHILTNVGYQEWYNPSINSAYFYKKAHDMDSNAIMSVNEYATIENPHETVANPTKYFKIKEIQSLGYDGPLGMGLQGDFDTPNMPYMRSALDMLATANLPMWITELDVSRRPL